MAIKYNPKSKLDVVFRRAGTVFLKPGVLMFGLWGAFWAMVTVVAYKQGWHTSFSGKRISAAAGGEYMSTNLHTTISFLLSLLLGFKVNLSWQRYWAGVLAVRSMQNALVGGVTVAVGLVCPNYHRERLVHYLKATYHLSMLVLQNKTSMHDVREEFSPREHRLLQAMLPRHRPSYAMTKGMSKMAAVAMLDKQRVATGALLPQSLININAAFTTCLEIKDNPIPLPFTQALTVIMAMYVATLPLTNAVGQGWAAPVTNFFIAYAMAAVDALAIELEDPFGDDPNDLDLDHMQSVAFEQVERLMDAVPILDGDMDLVEREKDGLDVDVDVASPRGAINLDNTDPGGALDPDPNADPMRYAGSANVPLLGR